MEINVSSRELAPVIAPGFYAMPRGTPCFRLSGPMRAVVFGFASGCRAGGLPVVPVCGAKLRHWRGRMQVHSKSFKFCSNSVQRFEFHSKSVQSLNESIQSLNECSQHGLRLQTVSGSISQRGMERWAFLEPRMILFLNHESSLITRIHAACVL